MCYEIERSVIDVLVFKTMKAAETLKTKTILLGGGVSANKELIKELKKQSKIRNIQFSAPLLKFSGDNASMIALTALFSPSAENVSWQKIKPNSNLKING
jgi:N6-L-threonylcarbamoyladenine synthase